MVQLVFRSCTHIWQSIWTSELLRTSTSCKVCPVVLTTLITCERVWFLVDVYGWGRERRQHHNSVKWTEAFIVPALTSSCRQSLSLTHTPSPIKQALKDINEARGFFIYNSDINWYCSKALKITTPLHSFKGQVALPCRWMNRRFDALRDEEAVRGSSFPHLPLTLLGAQRFPWQTFFFLFIYPTFF